MKLTAADYGRREVIKEFRAVPQRGGPDVPVPVGSIVEALHNPDEDDALLLFRWDGQNYKVEVATYRANTKPVPVGTKSRGDAARRHS